MQISDPDCSPPDVEKDACGVGFIYRPVSGHHVIEETLRALGCVEHRGACGADNETGDGAGILTSIPWKIFAAEGAPSSTHQAVAVMYLPPQEAEKSLAVAAAIIEEAGFKTVYNRLVPVNREVLGELALATCPELRHLVVEYASEWSVDEAERRLMVARKRAINAARAVPGCEEFYIASFSCRTIVYKAMVKSGTLPMFYDDLVNPLFESHWSVFHRRFSTNTLPRWPLAQPFRMLAHNGEINTLLGNRNWMRARQPLVEHDLWQQYKEENNPVLARGASDSANLDNALEMLTRLEHSPEAALMQLVPEAYRDNPALKDDREIVDFYEFYAALQEPWDGPTLLVYSDGVHLGAVLDRNGLRPARYTIYADGSITLASETGIFNPGGGQVVERGRLGPGQMISVDLPSGRIFNNLRIKREVAKQYPYGDWLREHRKDIEPEEFHSTLQFSSKQLLALQQVFGYGKEDVEQMIVPMSRSGEEPVFSMGDDTPLAILSQKPRIVFDYFKQRFAQVTNPPIDPLRERIVMELDTFLGRRSSYLKPTATGADVMHLTSPVLNERELEQIVFKAPNHVQNVSLLVDIGITSLETALRNLCEQALNAVQNGKTIVILTDRGIDNGQLAIPALLAVGAIHQFLIEKKVRLNCSIVVESGQCWSSHHFACLLGYGAQAVCPYLALDTVRSEVIARINAGEEAAQPIETSVREAQHFYRRSVEYGLRKVLSKLGLSVLTSYIGAQAFECLGLGPEVISLCFRGTASRIGGLELQGILRDVVYFHGLGFPERNSLINVGIMKYRPDGEYHGYHPKLVRALHSAIGLGTKSYNSEERQQNFKAYGLLIRERPPLHLRDLLEISSDRGPIDISEVEGTPEIISRFLTGGMSLGALSKEAHEVLAIAMNRIGGKSNSGEGGEDPKRYYPIQNIGPDGTSPDFPGLRDLKPGDRASSAVRQVASARFGVTPEYLATAKQLEIKIAQGAKPGEGGQLPGHKVSEYIASLRLAKPGAPLISPPPHHDIYSIEDLAQLIFDLKQVNPRARVSVKLVAEIGIGTIAAGVAKANADIVQISGHDGGTGASPITSIRHTGAPWELGLVETHRALLANQLRERVTLRVDGGIRSGWDVIMAALMGAEEYGFGTIALVAEGCIMARICHTNNCPVGITSHKEALRKRFPGSPEPVIEFFVLVAEEVRHILAEMGYHRVDQLIGKLNLLKPKQGLELTKGVPIDLAWLTGTWSENNDTRFCSRSSSRQNGITFDDMILADPEIMFALDHHQTVRREYTINNTDRTIGAKLAGEIAIKYGERGFHGQIDLIFDGFAGQSFGAFNVQNVNLILNGEANDYVGKGMNGGEIVIFNKEQTASIAHRNVLVGNTCLYGATGGKLFVAGEAGERFAVRNSLATAVVEGVGDHGCEYMTGGKVVVLGTTGRNFGAGMTGGLVYIHDEDGRFNERCNLDDGRTLNRLSPAGEHNLRAIIEEHLAKTGSEKAARILSDWNNQAAKFWLLVPTSEADSEEILNPMEERISA